jgi:hypothetical protein
MDGRTEEVFKARENSTIIKNIKNIEILTTEDRREGI